MLIIAVTFTVAPEHADAFRTAVVENATISVRDEAHCHVFEVSESAGKGTFFLYEKYSDDAAFDHHLATPHFKDFDQLVTPWVTGKVVNRYYVV